jgi:hypothetical protein
MEYDMQYSSINPTLIVIEAFIRELWAMYERTYAVEEPSTASTPDVLLSRNK